MQSALRGFTANSWHVRSFGGSANLQSRFLRQGRRSKALSGSNRCKNGYNSARGYATEYRTPANADIYELASPPSKWNYLYFLMPLTCFGLGYWQWQRLEWKENLIRTREQGLKEEPRVLDFHTNDYDPLTFPRELAWRPVSVTGKWLHHKEIQVGPRVLDSKGGVHVITPLELSTGERILVNRGFVPTEKKDRTTRPESLEKGEIEVRGTLREIQPKPQWVPENDPARNLWYWVDIPAMALKADTEPYFMEQLLDEQHPTRLPIGGQLHQPLSNNHFTYMLTWFTLGAALTGMSFLMVRRGKLPPTGRPPYIVKPKHRRKDMWFL